jgi:hypothetical protein
MGAFWFGLGLSTGAFLVVLAGLATHVVVTHRKRTTGAEVKETGRDWPPESEWLLADLKNYMEPERYASFLQHLQEADPKDRRAWLKSF